MIKVSNEVTVYELCGTPTDSSRLLATIIPLFTVESHWNEREKVVITIGGETVTVVASDLIAAIKNATNSNRF